jgi:hypothetical protein
LNFFGIWSLGVSLEFEAWSLGFTSPSPAVLPLERPAKRLERNPKSQNPNLREAPNLKNQPPIRQAGAAKRLEFEPWNFREA